MENDKKQKDGMYYIKRYIQEVLEAFVAILIIKIATDKELIYINILKGSVFVGILTLLLEEYNPEFKEQIRQGITFTVGSQLMSQY